MRLVIEADNAYVNSNNGLRLRQEPTTEAIILDRLPYGTGIEVIKDNVGEDGKWLEVEVGENSGYVHSDYVQEEDPIGDMEHLGNWHITAYTYTGNVCANGNSPTPGHTVACNSLDFGTRIYVEGIGERVVEDRGPGWLGSNWADVFMGSYNECVNWGSQYRNVYLLSEE